VEKIALLVVPPPDANELHWTLPVIVNEDPCTILTHVMKLEPPVEIFPIIVDEFEPVHLITYSFVFNPFEPVIFEVIVTPLFGIKNPPSVTADADNALVIDLTVILVSILTILLLANTSSPADGIIEPLHIAESLQFPFAIGHLFAIFYTLNDDKVAATV